MIRDAHCYFCGGALYYANDARYEPDVEFATISCGHEIEKSEYAHEKCWKLTLRLGREGQTAKSKPDWWPKCPYCNHLCVESFRIAWNEASDAIWEAMQEIEQEKTTELTGTTADGQEVTIGNVVYRVDLLPRGWWITGEPVCAENLHAVPTMYWSRSAAERAAQAALDAQGR